MDDADEYGENGATWPAWQPSGPVPEMTPQAFRRMRQMIRSARAIEAAKARNRAESEHDDEC